MDVTDLNGFEMIEAKKRLGTSIENADSIEVMYVFAWLIKKREDKDVTYEDVLGMTLREVQAFVDADEEEAEPFTDPKE